MVVTLYAIQKRINSTKTPTGGGKAFSSVLLKSPSSVVRPKISFKWDVNGLSAPTAYNYAYINDYQRYYWIDEWTYDDRQWTASMSVDVLASWKDTIGSANKYVVRADVNDPSQALIDNKYPALTAPYEGLTTTSGWGNLWVTDLSSGSIIVSVVGESNSYTAAGLSYIYMTPTEFNKMVKACFTQSLAVWNATSTLGANLGEVFQNFGENWLRTLDDPFKYIKGAMWFPFSVPHSSSGFNVHLGLIDTQATGYAITSPTIIQDCTATIPFQDTTDPIYTWYTLMEPYLTAKVRFFPYGIFPVDTTMTFRNNGKIYCRSTVDVISGLGRFDVYAGDNANSGYILNSGSASVGVPLAIANSSINYLDALRSSAAAVGNVATAVSAPTAEGVIGAAASVGNAIASLAPQIGVIGQSGGISGFDASPHVYYSYHDVVAENVAEFGRPLCEIRTLGNISGFIQCADPEIGLPSAYPEEIRQVGDYLIGGFYYE